MTAGNCFTFAPKIHADAQSFWEGCAAHVLRFQKCGACGHVRWPASIICPECHAIETQWIESAGRGTIYSHVVFRRAFHPAMEEKIPYIVAVVRLDEGPALLTNLVECDTNMVYCGVRARVVWTDVQEGLSLPLFCPECADGR